MSRIHEMYQYRTTPVCNEKAIVKGEKYRFTVLTSGMIRMEYSKEGVFEDRATKGVINRQFPVSAFTVKETEDVLIITTENVQLKYLKKYPFTPETLTARYYGKLASYTQTWTFRDYDRPFYPYPGEQKTRLGTIGSLDAVNPPIRLEEGILSGGFADYDDSKSMVIAEDGWVDARPEDIEDTYLFAYGKENSLKCLSDFLELSGKIPMLPRAVLGNWWTRYYSYSEEEYKQLLAQFKKEEIPITVTALDMGWHITDIPKEYGSGWTGYTWNRELFPDPKEFLSFLHKNGYYVGANLHDREGIAPHEACYPAMAEALGMNPKEGATIPFDFGDPKYVEAYFKYSHHPLEQEGMDFWWTDGFPKNNGSDPCSDIPWLLNHFHYVDSCRDNKRGVIFSRYAGIGSQRYPMGFSGDTFATWETLQFLPYFTATASNVGFGWWGHDIGGFMGGERDEEMMARWTQFGAFAPITRLHCCDNPFMSKEPWNYSDLTHKTMVRFLKFRHRLIPYIYTMNYKCYADNLPLVRPMYYFCNENIAGRNRNQYFFGDELIVSPITTHSDGVTLMGKTTTYLPEGLWFDLLNDRKYTGGRIHTNYRALEEMPVFIKGGGILPLSEDPGNSIANPENFEVLVYPGADNSFVLYEDDGKSNDYQRGIGCKTRFEYRWAAKPELMMYQPEGELSLIPKARNFRFVFKCITDCNSIHVTLDGKAIGHEKQYLNGSVIISVQNVMGELKIEFLEEIAILPNDRKKEIFDLIMRMQMKYNDKLFIYNRLQDAKTALEEVQALQSMNCDPEFKAAAMELITADVDCK